MSVDVGVSAEMQDGLTLANALEVTAEAREQVKGHPYLAATCPLCGHEATTGKPAKTVATVERRCACGRFLRLKV